MKRQSLELEDAWIKYSCQVSTRKTCRSRKRASETIHIWRRPHVSILYFLEFITRRCITKFLGCLVEMLDQSFVQSENQILFFSRPSSTHITKFKVNPDLIVRSQLSKNNRTKHRSNYCPIDDYDCLLSVRNFYPAIFFDSLTKQQF